MRDHVYQRLHVLRILRTMLLGRKSLAIGTAVLLLFSAILIFHIFPGSRDTSSEWIQRLKGHSRTYCPENIDWLNELDITYPIAYARRDILVRPTPNAKRDSITRIHQKLFPRVQSIDIIDNAAVALKHCKSPLLLEVPTSSRSNNASNILFGLLTTLPNLEIAIPQLRRWLSKLDGQLLAILTEEEHNGTHRTSSAEADKVAHLHSHMQELGMNVRILEASDFSSSSRVDSLSLVKTLYENRNNAQWMGLIDDDTFFPSVSALVSILSRRNPEEKHYIGGLPEGFRDVMHYGLAGHIGAGVFISMPLAQTMANSYEHCTQVTQNSIEQRKIMECINELSEIKLAYERSLYPLNLTGDLSGFFESGRLPTSLHNWKPTSTSKDIYDLPLAHQIADICQECFLQRWRFNDDIILTNGYSISRYRKDFLKDIRLDRMEHTMDDVATHEASNNAGLDHSLGPTRPKLSPNEGKAQHRLIQSKVVDGGLRQSYYHQGLDGGVDGLLELFWRVET
ncbi:uncharacterized protein KY384_003645 [Bacidia gigantensis]|uniref:uncharacterized protein n=1 Tax=Bacidia gigantensis TaxID=2732470 RepID=UPI001D03F526|nr:uncharacterized protein KY384_003645 [Bacidia gigantensis]KAG8532009.1 hypothetical protein KY384_003645 [Bacidia gigantensis]